MVQMSQEKPLLLRPPSVNGFFDFCAHRGWLDSHDFQGRRRAGDCWVSMTAAPSPTATSSSLAIGGAMGTGLFMGSTDHHLPGLIVLVYAIIGVMVFFVMRASHSRPTCATSRSRFFASDLLGPGRGSSPAGWFCWIVTGIAGGIAISAWNVPWFPDCRNGRRRWPAGSAAGPEPAGAALWRDRVLVRHDQDRGHCHAGGHMQACRGRRRLRLTRRPRSQPVQPVEMTAACFRMGPGFFAGFQIAVFAFVGIELVGTTAPRRRIRPHAAARHQLDTGAHHHLLRLRADCHHGRHAWRDVVPGKYSFVELFVLAPAAAGVINFVVLTSAASSANGGCFPPAACCTGWRHGRCAACVLPGSRAPACLARPAVFLRLPCCWGVLDVGRSRSGQAFTLVTTTVLFMFVRGR